MESGYKVFDNVALAINNPEGTTNLKKYEKNPDFDPSDPESAEWIEKSGDLNIYDSGNFQFMFESDKAGNVVNTTSSGTIDPLCINISSNSETWIYDGSSHYNHTLKWEVINAGDIPNMDNIATFVNTILADIDTSSMPEINKVGSVQNAFVIGNVSTRFADGVQNKKYVVDDKIYENGTVVGHWDSSKQTSSPNVIITTAFGTLTVSAGIDTVTIKGLEKTVMYDGHTHTLIGYTTNPPLNIPLAQNIIPDNFYANTTDKRDASDTPYEVVLHEDDFAKPANVANLVITGNVKLTITKRPLRITTGSDTMHFDDEEPEYIAKNETFNAQGLASTDRILINSWPSQSGAGSTPNEIDYDIRHEDESVVKSNYNITEEWGLLRIRHASDASVYYRIMGIRKDITTPDADKVHIRGLKRIDGLLRMVDEDRFYPALHKLVPISEDGVVDPDDVICIVPMFKHGKKIEMVTWMFENKSTGEKIFSKVYERPIFPGGEYGGAHPNYKDYGGLADTPVLNVVPRELKPGYYDVTVNYRVDHTDYSQKFSSVFVIKKNS